MAWDRMMDELQEEIIKEDMKDATKNMIGMLKEYGQLEAYYEEEKRKALELQKKYNVDVPVVEAGLHTTLWQFICYLERLRDEGKEVLGVFHDIKFSNMADNVYDAFREAEIKYEKEQRKAVAKWRKQEVPKIKALIKGLPEDASNYTLEDIVDILLKIKGNVNTPEDKDYYTNLTPDLRTKLFQFLSSAGFAPIPNDCPQNIDLNDLEQLKFYVIGNFMSQLQYGRLWLLDLRLLPRLANKIKDKQNESGTMKR